MAYLIALIIFFLATVLAITASARLEALIYFVNVPALILVFVPALTVPAINKSLRGVNPFGILFGNRSGINQEQVFNAYRCFRTYGNTAVVMGFITFFVSILVLLPHLTDPKAFGPAMATGLASLYYALFIKVVAYSAGQHVLQKSNNPVDIPDPEFIDWSVYFFALLPFLFFAMLWFIISK